MKTAKYGRLEAGKIQYADVPLVIDGVQVWTNDPAVYATAGYLPVMMAEKPQKDGYIYTCEFVELDGAIVQVWTEHEIPQTDEITDSEALAIITGGAV